VVSPPQKSNLISHDPLGHISDIKLIRTDTTLDLSQKAEKGMSWKRGWLLLLYQLSNQFLSWLADVGLYYAVAPCDWLFTQHSRAWLTTYFLLQTFIINFKCDERLLNTTIETMPPVSKSKWEINIISQIQIVCNYTNYEFEKFQATFTIREFTSLLVILLCYKILYYLTYLITHCSVPLSFFLCVVELIHLVSVAYLLMYTDNGFCSQDHIFYMPSK